MESILTSVKKQLGIAEDYEHFDPDLIISINSVFSVLNQLGVGPEEGYSISDANDNWSDFLPAGKKLELVKTYVYLKVRLIFDPPTSSAVMEAVKQNIAEQEWRILAVVDFPATT